MNPLIIPDALSILRSSSSTLGQIQRALSELEQPGLREVRIGISSNVIVDLLGVFLRKHALLHGVRLQVSQGNYDDPIGDMDRFLAEGIDRVVLLPCFDNLLPSFEAQAAHMAPEAIEAKEEEFRSRYRLAFQRASGLRSVFLGSLHRYTSSVEPGGDRVDDVLARFNRALREESAPFANIRWIDTEGILRGVGQAHAFDPRFYYGAKAPYTTAYFNALAHRISSCSRGFGSHYCKVLVLDCDNTLWGGVIGEDLLGGIKLGPHEHPGNVYWRVQQELVTLEQSGVLLCLCSKNNPEDVEEVLSRHPNAVLRNHHIVLRKVNWSDKVSNLRDIARELNLGLDSLVFLDDSAFECESVRSQLPMVRTFQVPPRLSEYPALVQEIKELFLAGGVSGESHSKTDQYRQRSQAADLEAGFISREEYLASLGLKVRLVRDAAGSIPRISELTMKSNQFNLTTRRYSEGEIQRLMELPDVTVYSLHVSDRFGDAGLTGILIMRWEDSLARVDSFLMSCRVIGRGIEKAVWCSVREDALQRGCRTLAAEYIPTPKNAQVAGFFDDLDLPLSEETPEGIRRYRGDIAPFSPSQPAWIEVLNSE